MSVRSGESLKKDDNDGKSDSYWGMRFVKYFKVNLSFFVRRVCIFEDFKF